MASPRALRGIAVVAPSPRIFDRQERGSVSRIARLSTRPSLRPLGRRKLVTPSTEMWPHRLSSASSPFATRGSRVLMISAGTSSSTTTILLRRRWCGMPARRGPRAGARCTSASGNTQGGFCCRIGMR
jgi:hypothetical protein